MYDKIIIAGFVIITPNELNQNLQEILYTKLTKSYTTCSREHGCVRAIDKIDTNFTSEIEADTSNIRINIKFLVERILPEVGKKINCTVHMIFNHGIFAQIGENIKILIPATSINGQYYAQGTDGYPDMPVYEIKSKKTSKNSTVTKNSTIAIEITDVKYNKNRYNCIGKLF